MSNLPSNKTLTKALVVFGGAQTFTVLAALVRTKVAAITIGTAGVGLNALYNTISLFVSTVMGAGLANSSVASISQQEGEEQRRSIAQLRLCAWLLSGLSIPVTLLLSFYYGRETMLLTLAVVAMIESGIEMAVLKSLKATRKLVHCLMVTALLSVVCTVPFFFWLGVRGVIWSVVCTSMAVAIYTLWTSYRLCDVRPRFGLLKAPGFWTQVKPMFVLGAAFLISGFFAQGVELFTQSWLKAVASLSVVGLYKAGFQLGITYPGMLFSAIQNDFYPRLSQMSQDVRMRNALITRQIGVQLMMAAPCILLFVALLPWIVPLLFNDDFLSIVPMVRIAAFAILLKAVYLPIGLLPVSMNRSWDYLLLEIPSWLFNAVGILIGWHCLGLTGIGLGLLLANTFDLCYVWIFCRYKYDFRLCVNK